MIVSEEIATRWFMKSINSITKIGTPNKMLQSLFTVKGTRLPPIGELLMYRYSPKYKLTLPYYDIYPLVLVVDFDATGFYGINLHYLPPVWRNRVMTFLITQKRNSRSQRAYIQKVYPLLLELSKTICMFAYKHYLCNHVTSKFIIVNPNYWKLVSKLPTQKFVGASQQEVWRDAIKAGSKNK